MEELATVAQTSPPVPDGIFYYTLTVILAGSLIAVIWSYTKNVAATLKLLTGKVNALEINDGKQDEKLLQLEKQGRIVKYPDDKRGYEGNWEKE